MNDEFDKLIKEAMQDDMDRFPKPLLSADEAWAKIEQQLNESEKQSRKSFFKTKIAYFITAAVLILTFSILFIPDKGTALNYVSDMFHNTQSSVSRLFVTIGRDNEKEYDPPKLGSEQGPDQYSITGDTQTTSKDMSLEEARKMTNFAIRFPKEVPVEFALKDVTVYTANNEKSNEINLNYEAAHSSFTIWITAGDEIGFGSVMEDGRIEEVTVNGRKASFILFRNGFTKLVWTEQDMMYMIEGPLTREEIINMANSM
ncbi:DUF4367 domain-containing protein [Bacillaceae bacterium Marseille-Q3522]|nr:DUF4367 domain-containing protein [Bacillaceae bacterium Marseille-Q3522]